MKRTIIWVIIAIFLLSACSAPSGAEQGGTTSCTTGSTQMASSTKPTTNTTVPTTSTVPTTTSTTQAPNNVLYESGFITVYVKNGNYIFQLIDGGEVEFSPDRKVVRTISIEPIKCDNYQDLINLSYDEIESMFGEPHIVVGSGICIPIYITEDAHILNLYLNYYNWRIDGVSLNDPIGNEPAKFWGISNEQ